MTSALPPGVTPAYLAQNRGPEIIVGSILPAVIASIFVLGRFYTRLVIVKNWGWDDSWILLSWVLGGIILTVLNCALVHYGAGKHIMAVPFANAPHLAMLGFISRIFYQVAVTTTKLGICAFYLRIFQDRVSKIVVWSMIAYNALFTIPLIFSLIFRCDPIAGNWTIDPTAVCRDQTPSLWAAVILNVAGDIALLIFVIPKISGLQIAPRQKASLIVVLCLSILVIIAAIARLVCLLLTINDTDVTWVSVNVTVWCSVEVNVGLFCAAAPAIKPLLKQIAPGLLSTAAKTGKSTYATQQNTYLSRKSRRGDVIELSSRAGNDSEYMKEVKSEIGNGSDKSELLSATSNGGNEIRKTVKITMVNEYTSDLEGRESVKRFEHV